MKTNDLLNSSKEDFREIALAAGIPEIQINDVSFMGEPCNGNLNIHGEYPDGTPYHNNITGEFANQGTTWEELTYEEIVSDDEDEVIGFAIIKCKDWV